MPADQPLFVTSELTVRYGGVVANERVDVTVERGEIVGLIGPNGAGKTTFVDAVTGFARAEGEIALDGRRIERLAPHRRRAAGLARTWQAGELFADLTVADNLAVATRPPGARALFTDLFCRAGRDTDVEQVLADLELAGVAGHKPAQLSLGIQKVVGVGRAVVGGTSLLLLDEPAAGLDTHESREFGTKLQSIARRGIGVLLIDHDMTLVLETCDRIYVMDFGKIIAAGTPDEVRADPAVIAAYLGSPVSA